MTQVRQPVGPRILPQLTETNQAFWTGGAGGQLMVSRCDNCERWALPPVHECPSCGGGSTPQPVSGRARVYTWTVNYQKFHPDVDPPNLIAIVVLEEQDDLRVATNLVDIEPDDVRADLPVRVEFEDHGEIFYPVFVPEEAL
ncbi:MAG: OB-fold domain-containing protein [Acidobacteriota bacterium]|nr:OB-fold domain-containing protein [Acidobacteriota bacterium]